MTTDTATTADRYTVISSDGHAGADLLGYRPYLESRYHDDFDAWAAEYTTPWKDLTGDEASRNWDSGRRLAELHADGIVAEVIFPNTIPPFYPRSSLVLQPPANDAGDLEHRWAGLRAHNRWLADFCAEAPGQRAGIAQILLHDVDAAVAEVRWAKEAGLTGGVLLPGAPPGTGVEPHYSPIYEPLWATCAELEMPVNHHGGSAAPPVDGSDVSQIIFLLEVPWWSQRTLWHLITAGVLDRYPTLQLVLTEQGTGWIPERLMVLDATFDRLCNAEGSQEYEWGAAARRLSLKPSEYWARQCHVGSSFMRPSEVSAIPAVGVERIMWGNDYPHLEASYPYSREALALTFHGLDTGDVAAMLGGNAAGVYGFDLDALAPLAAEFGPSKAAVHEGIDYATVPKEAQKCPAFVPMAQRPR
jgi:predicted TIM-barrel fold metal-dependent hydrolase